MSPNRHTDNAMDSSRAHRCNMVLAFSPGYLVASATGPCLGSRRLCMKHVLCLMEVGVQPQKSLASRSESFESRVISLTEMIQDEVNACIV